MAFKLAKKRTFKETVKVHLPLGDGKFETSELKIEYISPPTDELDVLRTQGQIEVLKKVIVGFEGLVDDAGAEVGFDETTLNGFLAVPQAAHAAAEKFWTSLFKAPVKN